ncbi:uncharacterized protein LOC132264981 isoform X2 [Phlebotomus argentipes]|uniref:uncharacterized protein LOC132264981 isoform X2 n=1 Tax=Phlebotomus argentipes TaxID=94469 RepID=UPI00289346FE|nr:uncharacterized protein LOC132264981 isoform X2 [Phlebotomus argentipes]
MDRRSKINKSTEEKNAGSESILPGNALDKNESGANCLGKRKKSSRNRQPAGRSSTNWSLDQWLENCMHPDSGIVNSTATGPLILSRENNSSPRIFPTMSQAYPANVYEPIYNHTPLSFSTPDASKNGPSHVHGSDLGSPSNELERENAPKSLQENLQGAADVEKNRFSDLGMTSMSDNDSKERDEEDELSPTSSRDHSNANNRPAIEAKDGKLLATLLEQISLLHDTNAKICRNLHETKVEIEALKHAPSWSLRHRRDSSVSGFSTHSQPLGYVFGTHSPAPTYHSGMYTPGMVTDVIREVRDGARIREEAMIHKVKSMLEENSWAMSEMKIKLMREMEELKMEMQHLRTEKKELSNKVLKMENEMHTLRVAMNNNNSAKVQKTNSLDAEKHLNSAHVNYGVVKQEDGEFYEVDIVNSPAKKYSTAFENRIAKPVTINSDQNRFYATQVLNNGSNKPLDSMTKSLSSGHLVQQEKDTLELRRELQDAIAGKKHAERRILDLERTVANLQKGMNRSSPTVDGSQEITTNSTMTKSAERHSSHVKIDLESPNGKNSTIIPVASQIQTVGQKAKICLTGMVTDL